MWPVGIILFCITQNNHISWARISLSSGVMYAVPQWRAPYISV